MTSRYEVKNNPYIDPTKEKYERAPGHISPLAAPYGDPPPDPVTETIRIELLQRQRFGWTKYGIGLGRADFTMKDWLKHLYEELLDAAQYSKRLMMTIDGILPITGPKDQVEIKDETPNQEIARTTILWRDQSK
jgi:hypothetical protein